MELTQIQRDILLALITLARQKGPVAIKGEEIAEIINRNPGTVRNQMQALRALGLVEGVPGTKGGYRPTAKSYEVMSITPAETEAPVPVYINGELVEDLVPEEIDFTTLRHPEVCQANIRLIGDIKKINIGDVVRIGPTPVNELVLVGEVVGRDDTQNSVLCSIIEMVSMPKKTVSEYMKSPVITVKADDSVLESTKKMVAAGIVNAPVESDGKLIGLFTLREAAKALSENRVNYPTADYMARKVVLVPPDTSLREAISLMNENRVRLLVVVENNRPVGVITETNVLRELTPF
jgi:hypothetical protein